MAFLEKRTFTRHLDAEGRRVPAGTDGARKVKEKSSKWYGQYVDAEGRRCRVPLCTDKVASRQMLADLERTAERGKAGMTDPHAPHRKAPIQTHVDAYAIHLRNKGVSAKHHFETLRRLRAVLAGCKVKTLSDIRAEAVEQFLAILGDEGASARHEEHLSHVCEGVQQVVPQNPSPGRGCSRHPGRRFGRRPPASPGADRGRASEADEVRQGPPRHRGPHHSPGPAERPARGEYPPRGSRRAGAPGLGAGLDVQGPGPDRTSAWRACIARGSSSRPRRQASPSDPPRIAHQERRGTSIPLLADLAGDLRQWLEASGRSGDERVFRVPVELVKILAATSRRPASPSVTIAGGRSMSTPCGTPPPPC